MKRKEIIHKPQDLMYELTELYGTVLVKTGKKYRWVGVTEYSLYLVALVDLFHQHPLNLLKSEVLLYLTEAEVQYLIDLGRFWEKYPNSYDTFYFRYIEVVHRKRKKINWERKTYEDKKYRG